MGAHIALNGHLPMKTTIELADDLAIKAKRLAAKHNTTLRAVVEDALRRAVEQDAREEAYQLPDRSVGGNGLRQEFSGKAFSDIRQAAYEGL